jgi:transcriptional regulator with XRE-family HTH domain
VHPASEHLTQPGGLAERLNGLREVAGLTGETLAGALGWSPSKVSKILNGRQIPSEKDIRAWAEATGHPGVTDELLALRREAGTIHGRWRRRLAEGGITGVQQDINELTRSATRIRNAQVTVIPGLLQIPGYARSIFSQVSTVYPNVDVDSAVEARMRRREILHEEGRTFEFIIAYAALAMPPCPPKVMLAQLDRLMMSIDLENVTLGIIPEGRQLAISFYNGFQLLDDLLVVESYGYEDQVTGELAEAHARIFDMLMAEAARDEDARRLIMKAASRLREGSGNDPI